VVSKGWFLWTPFLGRRDISWRAKLLPVSFGKIQANNADIRQVAMIASILKQPVTNLPSGCPVAAQQRADLMGSMAIVKWRVMTCSWHCYNWSAVSIICCCCCCCCSPHSYRPKSQAMPFVTACVSVKSFKFSTPSACGMRGGGGAPSLWQWDCVQRSHCVWCTEKTVIKSESVFSAKRRFGSKSFTK